MPRTALTRTMAPFNNGNPLVVVCLHDGRMGILDEAAGHDKVWIEHDMASTRLQGATRLPRVVLPSIPTAYGQWVHTSIGGVSATVRRVKILRAGPRSRGPIVMFAVKGPSAIAVQHAFQARSFTAPTAEEGPRLQFTVGDTEFSDEYGYVTEVIVHHADDVAYGAALVARAGAIPMLEDCSADAQRGLGIERLDRIGAQILTDDTMVTTDEDVYGLRRGSENWRFPWLPDDWVVPITWDHMVHNVIHHDIETLPQPLRQHVAKARLDRGDHPPIGSLWEPVAPKDVPSEHVLRWNAEHKDDGDPVPFDVFHRILAFPPAIASQIATGGSVALPAPVPLHCMTCVGERWYRPRNTRQFLERHILKGPATTQATRRWVTPHLEPRQSKQLIEAFYLLTIEQQSDPTVTRALKLILFQYMKERGYTARWLGKYDQDASHIGNGDSFRKFQRLHQYDPHRLPTDVLNKLCSVDGTLRNRGSKGTRSKYKQTKRPVYTPKRRMVRTTKDERAMAR